MYALALREAGRGGGGGGTLLRLIYMGGGGEVVEREVTWFLPTPVEHVVEVYDEEAEEIVEYVDVDEYVDVPVRSATCVSLRRPGGPFPAACSTAPPLLGLLSCAPASSVALSPPC